MAPDLAVSVARLEEKLDGLARGVGELRGDVSSLRGQVNDQAHELSGRVDRLELDRAKLIGVAIGASVAGGLAGGVSSLVARALGG